MGSSNSNSDPSPSLPPSPNSNSQLKLGCCPALAVCGEEAYYSSLLSAHALPRWLWSAYGVRKGTTTARGLSLSARDRVATCQLPPPTPTSAACLALIRRPGARCLYGVGAALEVAACARLASLVVVGLWRTKGHCVGERPLSFGARPWCDVPASASNANQRRVSCAAPACRQSLSGEEA